MATLRNIVLGALIIVLAQFTYVKSGLYEQDIQECNASLVHRFDSAARSSQILYFGESSDFTFAKDDKTQTSISGLIEVGPLHLSSISMGAIHAGVYRTLLSRLPDNPSVKTAIVTINLRSFGINWIQSKLETNIARSCVLYRPLPPLLQKLMLSFKAYDHKEAFQRNEAIQYHYKHDLFRLRDLPFTNVRDWDAFLFDKGIAGEDGKKDNSLTNVACHFIKNYAFVIDEKNERLKDLDEIVNICRSKNIELIFHLLPENMERAEKLCGPDLTIMMKRNSEFIQNRYQHSVTFINNLTMLGDSCFIDRDWPTEHYNYSGRKRVADTVSPYLNFSSL